MRYIQPFIIITITALLAVSSVYAKKKTKVQRVEKVDIGDDDYSDSTEYEVKNNSLIWYAPDGTIKGKGKYKTIERNNKTTYIKDGQWVLYDDDSSNIHRGEFFNDVRYGVWTTYDDKNTKLSEITYKDNVKHGPSREYHDTGELMAKGLYADNKRTGTWTSYYKDNQEHLVGRFANNQMEGTWKEYSPDGWLISEGNYTNGLKNGTFSYYNSDKELVNTIQYKNDQITWYREYREGKLTGEGEILGDPSSHTKNGKWTEYYFPEGTKKYESVGNGGFSMGKKTGTFREYYPGNRLKAEGEYLQDKRSGDWIFYREDGKTVNKEKSGNYMMGKLRRELSKPSGKSKGDFDIDFDSFDMKFE